MMAKPGRPKKEGGKVLQITLSQEELDRIGRLTEIFGVSQSKVLRAFLPPSAAIFRMEDAAQDAYPGPSEKIDSVAIKLWGAFLTGQGLDDVQEEPGPEPAALAQQMQKMLAACDGAQGNTQKAAQATDRILRRLADLEVSIQNTTVFLKYLLFESEAAGRESELQKKLLRLLAESGVSPANQARALEAIGLDQSKKA